MILKRRLSRLFGKMPLRAIFVIPFVLQIVLAVGIVSYISYRNSRQAVDILVADLQTEISQRIDERLNQYLTMPHLLNQIETDVLESGQLDLANPETTLPFFWRNLRLFDGLNATFMGTKDGVMVGARRLTEDEIEVMLSSEATSQNLNYYRPDAQGFAADFVSGAPDYDPRQRSWYNLALEIGEPHWSPIYLDFATGMLVITAGQPVYDDNGEPLGVVGSAFQFEQVNEFLRELEIGENGQTFIMDREGLLVSSSTEEPIAKAEAGGLVRLYVAESENLVERETAVALEKQFGDLHDISQAEEMIIPIAGKDYYVRVTPKTDDYGLDWLVVVIVPESDFMAEIQANNRIALGVSILALMGAILIGILTTQWITRPLLRLRDAALVFSEGNLNPRVTLEREDELGLLANTFNQMADQLQDSFSLMQQSQARFESMFNYVPIMLFEEDFADVKKYLDGLQQQGITDLDAYFNANPSALYECLRLVKIVAVNQTTLNIVQRNEETLDQYFSNEELDVFRRELVAFASGATQFSSESCLTTGSGQKLQTYVRLAIVPGHEEDWSRVLVSVQDITHRLEMENALRQNEQRLKRAQTMAHIGDWEYDIGANTIYWSDEVFNLFERPLHKGPPSYDENMRYYLPEDSDKLQEEVDATIQSGQAVTDTFRVQLPSGKIAHHVNTIFPVFNADGYVVKLSGTVQDVTKRVLLEKQIQSQERLAAIGQLAAGIAHDFNNILSSITLYTDLLLRNLPDTSPQNKRCLETIARQTERATHLIQQILDFTRQSPLQRTPMNVLQSLQELVELLERTLPENITIEFTFDQMAYIANIDPTRFQQVFMNLAVNARDAMPEGGHLTFAISYFHLSPQDKSPEANMPPGDWVKIEVSDTGAGIKRASLSRVFEPFFTTKPPGKGTGLGLAQVYGIVTQHDGFITVASEPGQGTTFTIFLPMLQDRATSLPSPVEQDIAIGHGETILIVEDHEATREAVVAALQILNYKTKVATNGREALTLIQNPDEEIHLVLSDMMMPEMNGLELVKAMRRHSYQLPVVILSGYLLEDDLDALRQLHVIGILNKPPNLKQLAVLLRQGLLS